MKPRLPKPVYENLRRHDVIPGKRARKNRKEELRQALEEAEEEQAEQNENDQGF